MKQAIFNIIHVRYYGTKVAVFSHSTLVPCCWHKMMQNQSPRAEEAIRGMFFQEAGH